jgi:hypothetical protein
MIRLLGFLYAGPADSVVAAAWQSGTSDALLLPIAEAGARSIE